MVISLLAFDLIEIMYEQLSLISSVANEIILPSAWDSLDEKTVQAAIHHYYPNLHREVNLDGDFLDFLSPNHYCIELKKSSSKKGKRHLSRPNHAIGQVLGYKSTYAFNESLGLDQVTPVILLYGSEVGAWKKANVTRLRYMVGVRLWQLVSLANAEVIDLDTGLQIDLGSL